MLIIQLNVDLNILMFIKLSGRRFWEGIYVLYDYSAPRTASQQVQKYLSTPIAGNELNILRCACISCLCVWLYESTGSQVRAVVPLLRGRMPIAAEECTRDCHDDGCTSSGCLSVARAVRRHMTFNR